MRKLTAKQIAEIRNLSTRLSQAEIARRVGRSVSTVNKIIAGGEPPKASPIKPKAQAPSDDVPDEVPEGTPLATIDHWLDRTERAAQAAEADGNLGALASLVAKADSLLAAKRKATPAPKEDPNERLDMQREAESFRKKVFDRLEKFLAEKEQTP